MTEEEAKTKWCPFARTAEYTGGGGSQPRNRVADNRDMSVLASNLLGAQCIGPDCMAWRPIFKKGQSDHNYMTDFPTGHGFCGLAGKP